MTKSFIEQQQELARDYIKANAMGQVCKCGGGGTDDNNKTCSVCGGCGIYDWEVFKMDTLITQIITNLGEELMRRCEGERKDLSAHNFENKGDVLEWDIPRDIYDYAFDDGLNQAIDTMTKHITSLTGVDNK